MKENNKSQTDSLKKAIKIPEENTRIDSPKVMASEVSDLFQAISTSDILRKNRTSGVLLKDNLFKKINGIQKETNKKELLILI